VVQTDGIDTDKYIEFYGEYSTLRRCDVAGFVLEPIQG
jgi:hypothetical protein